MSAYCYGPSYLGLLLESDTGYVPSQKGMVVLVAVHKDALSMTYSR